VHFSVRQYWLPIGSSRLPAMQAQHLMRASERSVPDCHDTRRFLGEQLRTLTLEKMMDDSL
jgi:hypothetical protein